MPTELRAGLATFLTMAYIIFVNPNILGDAGMDRGAVITSTILAAAFAASDAFTQVQSQCKRCHAEYRN